MRNPEKRPAGAGTSDSQRQEAWESHEHVTVDGQLQAQKLISTVGTPELAKQAIDRAQEEQSSPANNDDELARRLGYGSFLELFEASTTVNAPGGQVWCVTPTSYGKWVAWDRESRSVSREFETQDAATAFIQSPPVGEPKKTSFEG